MLVLSRKVGEVLKIGDDIRVRIVRVQGNCIRVGVDAPKTTRVIREELCEMGDGKDQPGRTEI